MPTLILIAVALALLVIGGMFFLGVVTANHAQAIRWAWRLVVVVIIAAILQIIRMWSML